MRVCDYEERSCDRDCDRGHVIATAERGRVTVRLVEVSSRAACTDSERRGARGEVMWLRDRRFGHTSLDLLPEDNPSPLFGLKRLFGG